MGEQCEIFVMKANVEYEAMIYNIQNLQFEPTELGGEEKCLSYLCFRREGHFPCSRMLRYGRQVLKLVENLFW